MRKFKANGRNGCAAILAMVAMLLSVSCGGIPNTSKAAVASASGLVVNTSSLDFGAIAMGASKKSSITVTNSSAAGGGAISVTNIVVTGAGFIVVAPTAAFSLSPGQSSTVTVKFAPKAAGNVDGQLSIYVAGTAESSDIALSGTTLTGNQLAVSPAKLAFGTVTVGTTKTLTGTLSAGESDVTIASASWNGQGYSITGIDFPVTIPAGSSLDFSVSFAPQSAGAISGGIIFVSDATNSPTTETFTGAGGTVTQTAPGTPTPSQHSVSLGWNLEGGIDGYNIYRGTHSGGPYTKLNASPQKGSAYTDSSVKSGTTYYYVATAIDGGVESGYSDEVVAAVPSP
jgi:predicted outer membrane repeat protein